MPKGDNAGRPKGSRNRSRSRNLTEAKAARIIETGKSPLDILMDDLRFRDRELAVLEKAVREKMATVEGNPPEKGSILAFGATGLGEQFILALNERRTSAEKAAAFVHPKMSPTDGTGGAAIDLSKLTDAELDRFIELSRKVSDAYGTPSGTGKA